MDSLIYKVGTGTPSFKPPKQPTVMEKGGTHWIITPYGVGRWFGVNLTENVGQQFTLRELRDNFVLSDDEILIGNSI